MCRRSNGPSSHANSNESIWSLGRISETFSEIIAALLKLQRFAALRMVLVGIQLRGYRAFPSDYLK